MDEARTGPLTPKPIMEMATAFQRSRPLLTAFELGLFTTLNAEARTSEEVADALGTHPRATDRLMNALVGLGLLEKRDGRFSNTALTENAPREGAAGIHGRSRAHESSVGHVEPTDGGGAHRQPAGAAEIDDRGDDWLRPFIAAMHFRAKQNAAAVVGLLDLDGVARLLDLGGGSGAYAMAFARTGRGISAVVFDLPNVVPLTKLYIAQEGLTAEVTTATGDYLSASIGGGYDMVFMSAVIHSNSVEDNRLLMRKAAEALNPGGQIVVQDFLVNEERDGPLSAGAVRVEHAGRDTRGRHLTRSRRSGPG